MEPCQGPSLTGPPLSQPTCGCASSMSPSHAFAYDQSPGYEVFAPILFIALIALWLMRLARRAALTTLDLGGEPVAREAFRPRLVLSEGERRFFRAVGRAFARRPAMPSPAPTAKLAATASPASGTT